MDRMMWERNRNYRKNIYRFFRTAKPEPLLEHIRAESRQYSITEPTRILEEDKLQVQILFD